MSWVSSILLSSIVLAIASPGIHGKDNYFSRLNWRWQGLPSRRRLAEEAAVAAPPLPIAINTSCLPGCNIKGVCNEELARCDCPRHFTGPSCSDVASNIADICANYGFTLSQCRKASPCFNSCNQRGRCVAGICHCQPGYWGMDCSLSWGPDGKVQLLEGNYVPRKDGLKIYVYELPPNLTSWFNIRRLDRPLHLLFWQRLMSAGLRTADGNEADYYFIPVNTRTELAPGMVDWTISYIQTTYPWWSKDLGHRHLIIHTGDMGLHDLPSEMRVRLNSSFSNITWLTHWGIYRYHPVAKWYPAHRPGKDVVIPVMVTTQGLHLSPMNPRVAAIAARRKKSTQRTGTFFFAGRICGDRKPPAEVTGTCSPTRPDYSGGVRQLVYLHHRNTTGFKVVPGTKTYLQDISTHKFCLAPLGGGHGKRQILVSFMGCVPVLIGDGVLQPFEPEIDWSKFSISVPEQDIPDLPQILNNVSSETLQDMQKRLKCAAQHMFYSSSLGAILGEDGRYDAFETIIEILRVRKERPDVPPEKYVDVDERFRKFIDCDLGGPDPNVLCNQGPDRQYKHMPTCGECQRNVADQRTGGTFFAWAGGLVCCSELDLTKCPRVWV
ncbi:hypothetical protein Vafri_1253 [Volvox africanus]|nr:hypothetical protein Vafri_1253 [Volvox africanus]